MAVKQHLHSLFSLEDERPPKCERTKVRRTWETKFAEFGNPTKEQKPMCAAVPFWFLFALCIAAANQCHEHHNRRFGFLLFAFLFFVVALIFVARDGAL